MFDPGYYNSSHYTAVGMEPNKLNTRLLGLNYIITMWMYIMGYNLMASILLVHGAYPVFVFVDMALLSSAGAMSEQL